MPIFDWNDNYTVGVKTFDEQHKYLINLINELHDAMREGKGNQELNRILDSLIRYTAVHFASEEKEMLRCGYPGYAKHCAEHQALRDKVLEFQTQVRGGKIGLTIFVANFLKDWLSNHIMREDQTYAPYMR